MKRLLAIPVFAATLSAQMYPAIWKLAHPDAKALIGVDVHSLRAAKALQSYGSEVEKSGMGMFLQPSMEFLKDIDQVFVSSPGAKPGSNKKDNPPFLVVLTGHFTPAHVQKLFGRPYRAYSTFDLYGSAQTSVAFVDEHTIVLGDEKSVRGGIDRMGQHPATNDLLTRAAAMAANHEFWLIATVPPSAFQPANVNLSPLTSEIEGLDAGLSMKDGLQFELSLSTKTPDTAKLMAAMLTTQLATVPQADEVLRKLAVTQEGTKIGVKIALDQDELDRMVRTLQASQVSVNSAKPQLQETPKTIKILGLDEGVREIPLGSTNEPRP